LFFIRKDKNLTAPLTFVLSRKGREENERKNLKDPLTLPFPAGGEGKEDEKILTAPLTLDLLSRRWRGKERERFYFTIAIGKSGIVLGFVTVGVCLPFVNSFTRSEM
jgi:hypothetical protein